VRTFPVPVAAVAAVLLLAACGSGDDPTGTGGTGGTGGTAKEAAPDPAAYADTAPEQILEDANEAMSGLTSVHAEGRLVDDGQEFALDLSVADDDTCEGSLTLVEPEGGSIQLVSKAGKSYVKPDREFWRHQGGAGAEILLDFVGDSWVAATGKMAGVAEVCDWSSLELDMILDPEESGEVAPIKGTGEVDGADTVTLLLEDGDDQGVVHVLLTEPHRVVRMKMLGEGPDLTLSDFDEPVEPEVPEDVVDLADLRRSEA